MKIATVYILIAVLGSALGQVLLKKGMMTVGAITLSAKDLGQTIFRMLTNPFVFIGLGIYVIGTLFWLTALSRLDLSYAYPFASLSYVIMLLAAWIIFKENITTLRVLGSFVIIAGVLLVARG